MKKFRILMLFGCVGVAALTQAGLAQQPPGFQQTPPLQQAGPQAATAPLPNAYRLNMMIRSSIIALNQANKTGNYTVLLDLASPSFRASNDSNRLGQIFARLRQRDLDLSPILFYTPKLLQQPQVAPNGLLRLVGFFPTDPERVNFDLYFQMVGDEWKLFGIGVEMSPADVTASVSSNGPGNRPNAPNTAGANTPKPSAVVKKGNDGPSAAAEAPLPEKKPEPFRQVSGKSNAGATETAVENHTTNNATRIDLSQSPPADMGHTDSQTDRGSADSGKSMWESFNLFSAD